MPKWTKEQKEAIEDRNKNLLVSAAAGSGKTAVLVERIVKLALNGFDIDRMLIVTFTRAAASEMKERIMEAFNREIISENENLEIAKRQINLINKSMIMTIHSFCTTIIRKYFHKLDIDPNFRVMETIESEIMKQESLDEILEEEYRLVETKEQENIFINLIEMFTNDRDDKDIENIIREVYNFIQSQPYPYAWLDSQIEKYNINECELENSQWYKILTNNIIAEIKIAKDLLNEALEISLKEDGPYIYLELFKEENEYLEKLLSKENIMDIIEKVNLLKFKSLPRKKIECDENLRNKAKELRTEAKKRINSIKVEYSNTNFKSQSRQLSQMYEPLKHLSKIIKKFEENYSYKKSEKGVLDFNDLEHKALNILEDQAVQDEIKKKFEHIFIDEYQDSNIVQETIINRIKRKDNIFLVGDVKQSIYRFRLADPTLFLEKYKRFKLEKDINKRIDLNKNFRSREEILGFVNYIFENIMSEQIGEMEYDEYAKLYPGAEYRNSEYDRRTEVNIIDLEGLDNDIDEYLNELKKEEIEAKFIANRIKELKKEKTYDVKTSNFRKIQNKDIVILLRTMKNKAEIFEQILIEEDIPVYTDSDKGYFSSIEIKVFLNLLRIIDNIIQDIPLISTMKSFIGSFTLEELTEIRLQNRECSYYEAIIQYLEENEDDLSKKISGFLKKIEKWRKMSRNYKLDEFIWKVMIESNYYYYVGTLVNGKQRQANLELLVDRANELESTSISGLFNFIRFSDRLRDVNSDFGTAKILGENEDVVRIMSIHKSKGLEFPIVICADLNKRFNEMDTRKQLLFHKDLGIGIDFIDLENRVKINTIPKKAIKEKIYVEMLSEEMRILYVAMTRAKDKLILFGNSKLNDGLELKDNKKAISFHNIIKANSFMDWIKLVVENSRSFDDKFKLNIKNKSDLKNIEVKKEKRKEKLIKKLNELKNYEYSENIERLEWKYPNIEETIAKSRFGAIEYLSMINKGLNSSKEKITQLDDLPNFIDQEKNLITGAQLGTAVHSVIDSLEFNKKYTNLEIKNKAKELIANEIISEEEFKRINFKKIESFFNSVIYNRILNSENVRKEQPFVYKMEDLNSDIYIQGIIDCMFEENGKIILLDYKTDRETDENYFIKKYKDQLDLYEQAMKDIMDKEIKEKIIYSIQLEKSIKV